MNKKHDQGDDGGNPSSERMLRVMAHKIVPRLAPRDLLTLARLNPELAILIRHYPYDGLVPFTPLMPMSTIRDYITTLAHMRRVSVTIDSDWAMGDANILKTLLASVNELRGIFTMTVHTNLSWNSVQERQTWNRSIPSRALAESKLNTIRTQINESVGEGKSWESVRVLELVQSMPPGHLITLLDPQSTDGFRDIPCEQLEILHLFPALRKLSIMGLVSRVDIAQLPHPELLTDLTLDHIDLNTCGSYVAAIKSMRQLQRIKFESAKGLEKFDFPVSLSLTSLVDEPEKSVTFTWWPDLEMFYVNKLHNPTQRTVLFLKHLIERSSRLREIRWDTLELQNPNQNVHPYISVANESIRKLSVNDINLPGLRSALSLRQFSSLETLKIRHLFFYIDHTLQQFNSSHFSGAMAANAIDLPLCLKHLRLGVDIEERSECRDTLQAVNRIFGLVHSSLTSLSFSITFNFHPRRLFRKREEDLTEEIGKGIFHENHDDDYDREEENPPEDGRRRVTPKDFDMYLLAGLPPRLEVLQLDENTFMFLAEHSSLLDVLLYKNSSEFRTSYAIRPRLVHFRFLKIKIWSSNGCMERVQEFCRRLICDSSDPLPITIEILPSKGFPARLLKFYNEFKEFADSELNRLRVHLVRPARRIVISKA